MTPDERAAMERYRDSEGSEIELDSSGEPTGRVFVAGSLWDAVTDLADAFLREHPEGGELPWTEEWLRSIGFADEDCHMLVVRRNAPAAMELRYWISEGDWSLKQDDDIVIIPTPSTRADVLRLLRALLVEVKQ